MPLVTTLTLNPAIDASSEAERVAPTVKTRISALRLDPGGGGINVARVLARLGCDVEAIYLAGGITGGVLDGLLERCALPRRRIAIAGDTRMSMMVRERASGLEYRFVPEGPRFTEAEADACLAAVAALQCQWLVLSGSMPRGVEPDLPARIIAAARGRGVRVVLDTSGPALASALAAGGIELVKPSLEEMEQLAGLPLRDPAALRDAARAVVAAGGARVIVVSLGAAGALMVSTEGEEQLPALPVPVASAVGAGDSFVAAMCHGLAHGLPLAGAFRLGMAGGAAAVMTPGTDLAQADEIRRLAAGLGIAI